MVRPLSMCFAVGPMESGRYLHICSLFGHAASCVFLWRWLEPRLLPPPLFVDRVFLRVFVAIMTMEPALYSTWTESSSGKPNIHSNMFDQIPIASMSPPSAPSDDDVSYSSSSAEKTWDEPSALFHLSLIHI